MDFYLIIKMDYRKVASSKLVYYSILELFDQKSQYISIKFPLHKSVLLTETSYCSRLYGKYQYNLSLSKNPFQNRPNQTTISWFFFRWFKVLEFVKTCDEHVLYCNNDILVNLSFWANFRPLRQSMFPIHPRYRFVTNY